MKGFEKENYQTSEHKQVLSSQTKLHIVTDSEKLTCHPHLYVVVLSGDLLLVMHS